MSEQIEKPRDWFTLFLGVACAALAVLTLLLAYQNMNLKKRLSAAANTLPPDSLKVGDTVAPFGVVDSAGTRTEVAFAGQPHTLLLVFSSTCGACQETIPAWNKLLAEGISKSVRVVGIQTDFKHNAEAGAALSIPNMQFPVFGAADPRAAPMSKVPSIPCAAVLDANGAVTAVWFGVPTDDQVSELRHAVAS